MNNYNKPLLSLEGQVAIITKISEEFGSVIANKLAQSGAIICGIGKSNGLIWQSPENENSDAIVSAKFQVLYDCIQGKYDKINLLINTIETAIPLDTNNVINWQNTLYKDLDLAMNASKSAIKYFRNSGGGSIINVVNLHNTAGFPQDFGYINTKNALLLMTKKLASKTSPNGIRINNIVIGHPPCKDDFDSSQKYQQLQELCEAILFFASKGSNRITGEDIFVIKEQVVTTISS